jgi:GH25 family lysozyme M1 (1,4-beta-N-acetylmuramidase)
MGIRPVPEQFPITQTYYANLTQYNLGKGHGAVDFGVPLGTEVVSIADGIVWFADWAWNLPGGANDWPARLYQIKPAPGDTKTGAGIPVIVEYDDVFTVNAHLQKTHLNKGQRVRQGEVIGESGSTGSSTGPHLHFAVIPKPANWGNGYFGHVDPMPYIAQQYRKLVAGAPADTSGASMNGIDVSNWQGGINLSAVPADFVGVLATDGKGFKSPTLDAQITAAQRKTKRTMVYHFARVGQSDSDTQAKHFLAVTKKYIDAGAVPVLDWEEDTFNHRADWAIDWIRYVEKATGKKVWIYQRQAAAAHASWGSFRRPMWLARYPTTAQVNGYLASFVVPPVPGWDVVIWQYSDNGRLPGFNAPLDLNVAFGDPWGIAKGVGSATIKKEWYEMATLDPQIKREIVDAMREAQDVHFEHKRDLHGSLMKGADGKPRKGSHDSILRWLPHDIANINEKLDLLLEATRPGRIQEALASFAPGSTITPDELAAALLRQITKGA